MLVTKKQELEALKKIRKIVEEIGGKDSYVGIAFEGCFELAEENIENDFGCSMKQRADKAQADSDFYQKSTKDSLEEIDSLRKENEELKAMILESGDYVKIRDIIWDVKANDKETIKILAGKIVEFADDPDSLEFSQAVEQHRKINKQLLVYDALVEKISMIFN